MVNQEQNEIIDFESLFVKKTPDVKVEPTFPLSRAVLTVVVYFFIMLIVAGFAVLTFYEIDEFTKDYTELESMLYNVDVDPYAIGYLKLNDFNELSLEYPNVEIIYTDSAYVFFANQNNTYILENYTIDMVLAFYRSEDITWNNESPRIEAKVLMILGDVEFTQYYTLDISNQDYIKSPKAFSEITPSASAILNFAIYLVLAIALIPITLNTLKVEASYFKKPLKAIGIDAATGYVYMIVASIAAQFIIQIISFAFNYTQPVSLNQQAIEQSLLSSTGVLMIFITVIFAPVLEELVFRKAMFRFFKNHWIAMVVSSLVFGLIHVTSETNVLDFVTNLITYSASGFALGYVYIKNKNNVWASILVHAVANAVSIIFILILGLF